MITVTEFKLEHHRAVQAETTGMYHVAVQNYLHCLESVQTLNDTRLVVVFAEALARCYTKMQMFDKAARYANIRLIEA